MRVIRVLVVLFVLCGIAACAPQTTATRMAPTEMEFAPAAVPQYQVRELSVTVPTSLRVSEANSYYPMADIVWRGDPHGNRHDQVATIVRSAMAFGAAQLHGPKAVDLDVEVTRFHSLTEKTRYSFGGTHSIYFMLTIRDAVSGDIIEGPRQVDASFEAWGGARAIEAERNGNTQKRRITNHLAAVIQRQLGLFPEPRHAVTQTAMLN